MLDFIDRFAMGKCWPNAVKRRSLPDAGRITSPRVEIRRKYEIGRDGGTGIDRQFNISGSRIPAMKTVSVYGAGSMGTACAVLAAWNGHAVSLLTRTDEDAALYDAERRNTRHLASVQLPDAIRVRPVHAGPDECDVAILAVPSRHLRMFLESSYVRVPSGAVVVSVIKGIEEGTLARPDEIVSQTIGPRRLVVLGGPSHAEEIVDRQPTSVVAASRDDDAAVATQRLLSNDRFRVYTNDDPLGVELAGALKNVIGLAAGICDGVGYGDNAKATLLTRGIAEMRRFAVTLGGREETFFGLAGVGDLITTCVSPHGRNRAVGHRIGSGMSLEEATAGMESIAEGVTTARSVLKLAASHGVEMPIVEEVCKVLFERKAPQDATDTLMTRPPKSEVAT